MTGVTERDENLRPKDVQAEYGINTSTLESWRRAGTGPEWFPLGPRMVAYRRSAVEAWLRKLAEQRAGAA